MAPAAGGGAAAVGADQGVLEWVDVNVLGHERDVRLGAGVLRFQNHAIASE